MSEFRSASTPVHRSRTILFCLSLLTATTVFSTANAQLEIGQFWHSRDTGSPPTYYPTYSQAVSALKAVDGTTALMELEESADTVDQNRIGDRFGVPPVPVDVSQWTWEHQYTQATFPSEGALIADYASQYPNDAQCSAPSVSSQTAYSATQSENGSSTREVSTVYFDYQQYSEYWNQCFDYTGSDLLIRNRTATCELPRTGHDTGNGWMCTNGTKAQVYRRPVMKPQHCEGNPCDVANGDKIINETDYTGPGIEFKRTYHSMLDDSETRIGDGWTHSYSSRLSAEPWATTYVAVTLDSGYQEMLVITNWTYKTYASQSGSGRVLLVGAGGNWELYEPSGAMQAYDTNGRLLRVESASGEVTTITRDSEGRIDYVTGPYGHVLDFVYDAGGTLDKVVDPAGGEIDFGYATSPNTARTVLKTVTYQDSSVREYEYEYTDAERDTLISGITDENDDRFATYGYGTDGRVTLSEHAGGREKITLSYTGSTTQVIEDGGSTVDYVFSTDESMPRRVLTRTEAGTTKSYTYDPGNLRYRPSQIVDELGHSTQYTYGTYNMTSKTVAAGTPVARTTTYKFLKGRHQLPTEIKTPSVYGSGLREVLTTYNTAERPISVQVKGYTPAGTPVSRTTIMTYNANGQVLTVDGPRTGASDVTTFDYYDCTTGAECGQLESITNTLGHVTDFDSYDAHGRLTQMTDPNGLVTTYSYDARGRVLTVTQTPTVGAARVTTSTYDDAGQLTSVTTPDGMVLTYAYDAAHDLASVTDNFGNKFEYGYDVRGNRTDEDVKDPLGVLTRAMDTTYDLHNRVDTINAGGFTTDLIYDALGNLTDETDPDLETTQHDYDPLNRLTQTIDALAGVTDYGYDANDNLVSVDAPNGATTTYEYDDLGNLLKEVSPDRGTISYTHDAAGNVATMTDARGKVTTYTYDALNRLTQETLDGGATIVYEYDTGTNAIGRLNKITDASGNTAWTYDNFGAVTQKTQTIGTVALTTQYGYDAAGRLTSMTLPSGKVVSYGYNVWQPDSVTVDATTVLSGATYDPFGPVNAWTWGNASTRLSSYDLRGLMTSHSLASDTRTLSYDAVAQLTALSDLRHTDTFDYDALGRLDDFGHSGAAPLPSTQTFAYDANGNRTAINENGTNYTYSNQGNSNRLSSTTGPTVKTYTYDAAGNATGDGAHTYSYDDRGRLVTVDASTAGYQHNGQGQRVKKDNGAVTLFAYDEGGNLIGEYDASGNAIREHAWFAGAPVAVLSGTDIHYVHTDHLGTPRAITDGNTVIWRWESDPFGSTAAQEDPDGDSNLFTYNLRFPGQYYDSETGLHFNYFRDYDPSTGRYVESDPIGLNGGSNSYSYVNQNPISGTDPTGLAPSDWSCTCYTNKT